MKKFLTFISPLSLPMLHGHSNIQLMMPTRPSHMRRLYEICQSPTKIWKPLPGGDHNSSVIEEGYFESIEDFVANLDTKVG
jgi:hypothetical protein